MSSCGAGCSNLPRAFAISLEAFSQLRLLLEHQAPPRATSAEGSGATLQAWGFWVESLWPLLEIWVPGVPPNSLSTPPPPAQPSPDTLPESPESIPVVDRARAVPEVGSVTVCRPRGGGAASGQASSAVPGLGGLHVPSLSPTALGLWLWLFQTHATLEG